MLRVALNRVRYQFGSLLLVSLAVAAAVAFIASSFTLGDAIRAAVYRETAAQAEHVAAHVEGRLTDADVRTLSALPGVTVVQPRADLGTITLLKADGTVVRVPGNPILSAWVAPVDPDLVDRKLTAGAFPTKSGELVVPDSLGVKPGSQVRVLDTARREHTFTVTGTVEGRVEEGAAGLLPTDFATLLGRPEWSALDVKGAVTPDAVRTALSGDTTVSSGPEYADQLASARLGDSITDIIRGLQLFAWVAVVVAAAVAYNAFGIVLAQRQREVALVRCVGARRGQVFRAVIVEAAAAGLVAAVAGYVAGQGLAAIATYGLRTVGAAPDSLTVTFSRTAAVVALVVGVSVSVLAAVLPAWSATRVPPVRALSDQPELIDDKRVGWLRAGSGVLLVAAGSALAWYAADRHDSWTGIGGGLLIMLALLALGPVVVGPLVRIVGFPGRVAGAAGHLAAANGARHPRRTAAVTNALTIGIGLATVMLVGFASLEKTANAQLTGLYSADFTLTSVAPSGVLPAGLASTLASQPELQKPVPVRFHDADRIAGKNATLETTMSALDPDDLRAHLPSKFTLSGDLRNFGPGSVVVTSKAAADLGGVRAGDTVRVHHTAVRVAAVVEGGYGSPFGALTFAPADFDRWYGTGDATGLLVWAAPGTAADTAKTAVDDAIVTLPDVEVQDLAGVLAELESQVNGYLTAGGLLIGMAVFVAVLGVMVTLTLSVLERRREIAVLRALGLTRGQLYTTLTLEGAIMALLAAVVGTVLGLGLGIAGTYAAFGVQDDLQLGLPVTQIGFVLVGAAVIGVLAALPPARRASRTAPVEALATA